MIYLSIGVHWNRIGLGWTTVIHRHFMGSDHFSSLLPCFAREKLTTKRITGQRWKNVFARAGVRPTARLPSAAESCNGMQTTTAVQRSPWMSISMLRRTAPYPPIFVWPGAIPQNANLSLAGTIFININVLRKSLGSRALPLSGSVFTSLWPENVGHTWLIADDACIRWPSPLYVTLVS